MGSLCVATAALIIVMSGFNGMEDFLRSLFQSFDPELRIQPVKGKMVYFDPELSSKIKSVEGVQCITPVLEDKVLIKYKDKRTIATLKGVGDYFFEQNKLDSSIVSGRALLQLDSLPYAVLGLGIQHKLGVSIADAFYPLQIIYPKKTKSVQTVIENSFNQQLIKASGVFALEKSYDEKYVFVPLDFAQQVFSAKNKISSLELKLKTNSDEDEIKEKISQIVGENFEVLNRDEQNKMHLKVVKSEKLFVFFVLSVIILISSLNIFLCLTMLVIEKKHDLSIMKSFGMSNATLFKIFTFEGYILSFIGGIGGIVLGVLICMVQIKYQLLTLGTETAILDAYPVKIVWTDVFWAAFTVFFITFLASIVPSYKASKIEIKDNL